MRLSSFLHLAGLAFALAPVHNCDHTDLVPGRFIFKYRAGVPIGRMDSDIKSCIRGHPLTLLRRYEGRNGITGFTGLMSPPAVRTFRQISSDLEYVECALNVRALPIASASHVEMIPNIHGNSKRDDAIDKGLLQRANAGLNLIRICNRPAIINQEGLATSSYIYQSQAGSNITIYVLDTGIRVTHQEFEDRASWGKSFVPGTKRCENTTTTDCVNSSSGKHKVIAIREDDNGHGTHCAGTAVGKTVGVASKAKAVAVKVLDAQGHGTTDGLLAGIDWVVSDARSKGILASSVISISISGGYSVALNNAIELAYKAGISSVVAAGNENTNASMISPASAANAITVGSIGETDIKSNFSNYGKVVDIFAPGEDVRSAWHNGDGNYMFLSGTSMATPLVSGLLAHLKSVHGINNSAEDYKKLMALATPGQVKQLVNGTPNYIPYNGADHGNTWRRSEWNADVKSKESRGLRVAG